LLPCRVSALDEPPPGGYGLPRVGDDVLLDDPSAPGVYEVVQVGAPPLEAHEQPHAHRCHLRLLRWDIDEDDKLSEAKRLEARILGSDGCKWRRADVKFLFLCRVALGASRNYGSVVFKKTQNLQELIETDSWGGTEEHLDFAQVQQRLKWQEHTADYTALCEKPEHGRQFVVDNGTQVYPAYLVRYVRPRVKPNADAASASAGSSSDGQNRGKRKAPPGDGAGGGGGGIGGGGGGGVQGGAGGSMDVDGSAAAGHSVQGMMVDPPADATLAAQSVQTDSLSAGGTIACSASSSVESTQVAWKCINCGHENAAGADSCAGRNGSCNSARKNGSMASHESKRARKAVPRMNVGSQA